MKELFYDGIKLHDRDTHNISLSGWLDDWKDYFKKSENPTELLNFWLTIIGRCDKLCESIDYNKLKATERDYRDYNDRSYINIGDEVLFDDNRRSFNIISKGKQ